MSEVKNGSEVKIQSNIGFDEVGTIYFDEEGNVEIYIPENEWHTAFYLKSSNVAIQYKANEIPSVISI